MKGQGHFHFAKGTSIGKPLKGHSGHDQLGNKGFTRPTCMLNSDDGCILRTVKLLKKIDDKKVRSYIIIIRSRKALHNLIFTKWKIKKQDQHQVSG